MTISKKTTILTKTTKYALTNDRALMAKILGQVQDLENEGYEFEAAEASFDLLVKKTAGLYQPKFERLAYRVNVETDSQGHPITEATVKWHVNMILSRLHVSDRTQAAVTALNRGIVEVKRRRALAEELNGDVTTVPLPPSRESYRVEH